MHKTNFFLERKISSIYDIPNLLRSARVHGEQ